MAIPPTIVLASTNPGKLIELQELLAPLNYKIIPQTELQIDAAEETGLTFIENAILKARHVARSSGLPALSDDSGLCIDALHGAPGVYSARYAGPNASDMDRNEKVLQALKKSQVPPPYFATYHCVLAWLRSETDPAPVICHGTWNGIILNTPRGNNGFGYDPLFFDPQIDATAAELAPVIKNARSHRAMAFAQLLKYLQKD